MEKVTASWELEIEFCFPGEVNICVLFKALFTPHSACQRTLPEAAKSETEVAQLPEKQCSFNDNQAILWPLHEIKA
ncbi:unnamed protein product [Strongylus vulgaris]|uniref:Uncharacterized protein n=1 Tax=Strongylus vulgaris TaxID=40348 RepID=A0A3P7JD66_STRVU|nr:unnamed protein product [Strongylus vulgaris]